MLNLIENFKEKARKLNKTIVLPEGEEPRVIRAAEKITAEGFAKIIILGDEKFIREKCPDAKLDGVKIVNPKTSEKVGEYAKVLFELRKAKGMTEEEAERLIKDEMYYGVMMVKMGEADGMVGGGVNEFVELCGARHGRRSGSLDGRYAASRLADSQDGSRHKYRFGLFHNEPSAKNGKKLFPVRGLRRDSRTYVRTACGHCRVQRKIRKSFPCRRTQNRAFEFFH